MKYGIFAVLCLALVACQGNTQEKVQLKTAKDSLSYCVGLNVGRTLKQQMIEIDQSAFSAGIRSIIDSTPALLTDQQIQAVFEGYQSRMMEKHAAMQKEAGEKNMAESKKFLEENGKKEGVVTLPSGLQYKVIKAGSGKKPTGDQEVRVNYRGTLINGKEFDSSFKYGKPSEFKLNQVIKGWVEGIELMPVGSKYELYVPPDLGYGVQGYPPDIGPNCALIFEVELLAIL